MRALALLLVIVLATGCIGAGGIRCRHAHPPGTDCSYDAGGVSGSAWYANETEDPPRVDAAIRALGFTLRAPGEGTHERETIRVARLGNGTYELALAVAADSMRLGLTSAEANAENRAAQQRAEKVLADWERETGWTRDGEPAWAASISVA